MLNFLGIGAQKAATTWFYENLSRHPDVSFPAGKEVHFWDQLYDRGVSWYLSLFESSDNTVKGDITPAYALLPEELIKEIYSINSQLRVIYVIRNPVERAWSAALMALQRAEMKFDEASDKWFLDHFMSEGSRARGDYETCLRKWRAVFSPGQILIERYENVQEYPKEVLKRCCDHIGVDNRFYDTLDEVVLKVPIFKGMGQSIRPILRDTLREMYAQKTESLAHYLNDNFSQWIL